MKIKDESGTLQTYTTLREVPDENLRTPIYRPIFLIYSMVTK